MLTTNSRKIVLKHILNRFGVGNVPTLLCPYNRLSSTLNDTKNTVKSVADTDKKARLRTEFTSNNQSTSRKAAVDDKAKKKMGKYVEGEKINYKEVHKQEKIIEELRIVNDIKERGVKLSDFPLPSDNSVILPVSLSTGNSKDILKYRVSLAKKKFEYFDGDTGSPAVQIAIMTEKIKNLVRHFALHRKDHSSGRNFEILLSRRKRLLNYLRKYNFENFKVVIKELDLQKEGLELIRKNK